jgi:hypothetical protein
MTLGDCVYEVLRGLSLDLPVLVKSFLPDAKVMRIESAHSFTGKKVEWYIMSSDQRTTYSPVSFKGENEAWLYALQRVCRSKWPMPVKEFIQEGL